MEINSRDDCNIKIAYIEGERRINKVAKRAIMPRLRKISFNTIDVENIKKINVESKALKI